MYSFTFFLIWSFLFALLAASPVFLALAIFSAPLWFAPTAIAIIISIWARTHAQRVSIRSSLNPFGRCCRPRPTTRDALIDAARDPDATIVGSGWSSFLNRKTFGKCIFTDGFRRNMGGYTWESGATIHEVQRYLQKSGKTLTRFPSMEWVTLGGWISTMSHSHPGSLNLGPPIERASVYNKTSRSQSMFNSSMFSTLMGGDNIILDVTFRPIDDFPVERVAFNVDRPSAVRRWFNGDSTMRLMFAGSNGILGLIWRQTAVNAQQTYGQGVFGQWWDIDVMTYLGGRSVDSTVAKLNSDAGRFQTHSRSIQIVPNLFSTYLLWPIMLSIQNFEIFVRPIMSGMNTFLEEIVAFHKRNGGRSELRFNGKLLAIDFAISKPALAFRLLKRMGYDRLALHTGKRIVDCSPCERVRLDALQ